jgi:hypothetical protein
MVNNPGNSKCPKCAELLDGVSVVRYDGPFACPFCKMELRVPGYYKLIGVGISVGVSLLLCNSIGLRGPGLLVGFIIFVVPSMFTVSILQRKMSPPKLVACEDDSSPFS